MLLRALSLYSILIIVQVLLPLGSLGLRKDSLSLSLNNPKYISPSFPQSDEPTCPEAYIKSPVSGRLLCRNCRRIPRLCSCVVCRRYLQPTGEKLSTSTYVTILQDEHEHSVHHIFYFSACYSIDTNLIMYLYLMPALAWFCDNR